jgi:hypothetical protein
MIRISVALALACTFTLPARAALHPRTGPYELQLLVDGQPARSFASRGETWVLGQLGQRYTLRIVNRSGQRVEAVVSVDGRDVIDGQPAAPAKGGYLVPAWGSIDIDGWRISHEQAAAFRFSSVADSYAARTGAGRDVGVIGVAIFPEKQLPPPPAIRAPRRLDAPPPPCCGEMEDSSRGASQGAGVAGQGASQAPAAPAPSPAVPSSQEARRDKRNGLGTEYGEAVNSRIQEVQFERASSRPSATLGCRYDDRAGLLAVGIDVDRISESELRSTAEPFPVVDRQFAPPPPGWHP